MADDEQGVYPRINGEMLRRGEPKDRIVSLVGRVENFDGQTISLKTGSDDSIVSVEMAEGVQFDLPVQSDVELMGLVQGPGAFSLFVARPLGKGLDLELYNRTLTELLQNPKYVQYF
eukprot:CAMPEP_0194034262 /NCGR_PEP_ID=MMETSP0009_2-20130614/6668_1 /TAXON_ID=210454 /ORGANISM="Grammatophora oceanica, Strain CCMP 410" /LENGTH=116 /DNA_ID=CAMNT_0038675097 /DNA_START=89 /DNA_END=439 /DNA_ORIENTATION=-